MRDLALDWDDRRGAVPDTDPDAAPPTGPIREPSVVLLDAQASALQHVSVMSRVTTYGSMLAFGRRSSM